MARTSDETIETDGSVALQLMSTLRTCQAAAPPLAASGPVLRRAAARCRPRRNVLQHFSLLHSPSQLLTLLCSAVILRSTASTIGSDGFSDAQPCEQTRSIAGAVWL